MLFTQGIINKDVLKYKIFSLIVKTNESWSICKINLESCTTGINGKPIHPQQYQYQN